MESLDRKSRAVEHIEKLPADPAGLTFVYNAELEKRTSRL